MTTKKTKKDPSELITSKIIQILENNTQEGHVDWNRIRLDAHHNANGTSYNYINSIILGEEAEQKGYTNSQWLTFNQIKDKGGDVTGEKSTLILQYFPIFEKDANGKFVYDDDNKKVVKSFRKGFLRVFNINQTGLTPDPKMDLNQSTETIEISEITNKLINDFPTPIEFGGTEAFYRPLTNSIHMPSKERFKSDESLFSTLAHECAHATGHKDWLNRPGIVDENKFASKEYAKEELVAELASAITCSNSNVEYKLEHHAAYLKSWLKILNDDPAFIFKAMSDADRASKEIMKSINSDKKQEQGSVIEKQKKQDKPKQTQTNIQPINSGLSM